MFGFSISEALLIAAVAAAAWFIWKRSRRIGAAGPDAAGPPEPRVEDMIKCPVCDLYVPAKAPKPCERDDCPYRR